MREAERLGLQLFMHNSPGYSGTGGPWIPVEHSMKQLVWSESQLVSDGERMAEVMLPQPFSKQDFYREVCVLAYPALPGEEKSFCRKYYGKDDPLLEAGLLGEVGLIIENK